MLVEAAELEEEARGVHWLAMVVYASPHHPQREVALAELHQGMERSAEETMTASPASLRHLSQPLL